MTQVTFEIYVHRDGEQQVISEGMLAQDEEMLWAALRGQEVLNGALVISVPGEPRLHVKDELWALVQRLCFECVAILLQQRPECFLYRFTSYDGHLVIIPLADFLRFIGEHTPVVTGSAQILLPELFECGMRFLDLLDQLGGVASETSQYLRPFADRGRTALAEHRS